ncbi:MAG: hypothetical protein QOG64_1888, partial [Acidimicrobiaceae bacterium]|nr:hypothetical protein [Acidimicrobiaceae bacterium]
MTSAIEDRVGLARTWAATRFPYLATALFRAPVFVRPGIGTVAADEEWRIYVDPGLVEGWRVDELGSVFVHHVGHLVRDHADRARAAGVTDEDKDPWDDAADAEINDDLVASGLRLPGRTVLPDDLGQPRGGLAEGYYGRRRQAAPGAVGTGGGRRRDCGSVADGLRREFEDRGGGLDHDQRDLLQRRVAAECRTLSSEPGTVPQGWQRWADEVLGGRLDWRRILAAEVRRGVATATGAVDYSYRRPSRRASVVDDIVLPSLRRPIPDVVVLVDTSGSMAAADLSWALSEVEGLLRGMGLRTPGLRVVTCDTVVHAVERVRSVLDVPLVGGGGTDMAAGLEVAAALRPRPQVVVV